MGMILTDNNTPEERATRRNRQQILSVMHEYAKTDNITELGKKKEAFNKLFFEWKQTKDRFWNIRDELNKQTDEVFNKYKEIQKEMKIEQKTKEGRKIKEENRDKLRKHIVNVITEFYNFMYKNKYSKMKKKDLTNAIMKQTGFVKQNGELKPISQMRYKELDKCFQQMQKFYLLFLKKLMENLKSHNMDEKEMLNKFEKECDYSYRIVTSYKPIGKIGLNELMLSNTATQIKELTKKEIKQGESPFCLDGDDSEIPEELTSIFE